LEVEERSRTKNDGPMHGPCHLDFHRNSNSKLFSFLLFFTITTAQQPTQLTAAEMAAPTALLPATKKLAQEDPVLTAPGTLSQSPSILLNPTLSNSSSAEEEDGGILLDPTIPTPTDIALPVSEPTSTAMQIDTEGAPQFPPSTDRPRALRVETRKVAIPPHRFTPLKNTWAKIYPPLVTHLKLQVRMNVKTRSVELRTSSHTDDTGALQKGEDFVRAFSLGFDVDDAIALLRLDDLYIETFEIKDVKTLNGDHLSRAIGRIAGKDGKTKYAIENASKTRIVLADSKIHILGGFQNIHVARESVVSLILGAPPGKVYQNLRTVSTKMKDRF
jgi:RNA-binding protein PNO1